MTAAPPARAASPASSSANCACRRRRGRAVCAIALRAGAACRRRRRNAFGGTGVGKNASCRSAARLASPKQALACQPGAQFVRRRTPWRAYKRPRRPRRSPRPAAPSSATSASTRRATRSPRTAATSTAGRACTVDAAERVARLPDLQVRHLAGEDGAHLRPRRAAGRPSVRRQNFCGRARATRTRTQRLTRASAPPADRASCRRPRRSPSDHTRRARGTGGTAVGLEIRIRR